MNKEFIERIKREANLGATGRYPHDKFGPLDEGELKSAIVKKGEFILIVFGKPVEWVSLTKEGARQLGNKLIEMSEE